MAARFVGACDVWIWQASPGAVHTSKGQTVADTAQIDLFDGKLGWMHRWHKLGAAPPAKRGCGASLRVSINYDVSVCLSALNLLCVAC
jgi:hypothetical protein